MLTYIRHKQKSLSRQVLVLFVLSWLGLIGQANAHTLMMVEMQQHKSMGHDVSAHCQPVLCESVIAVDNQSNNGLDTQQLLDLSQLPASISLLIHTVNVNPLTNHLRVLVKTDYGPPPLNITGILLI